jgi:hypothetical protein
MIHHLITSLKQYCFDLHVEARISSNLMKAIVDTLKTATTSSATAGLVETLARARPDYQSALQGCAKATEQISTLKAMLIEVAMYQPEVVSSASASSSSMPALVDGELVQWLHDCIAVFESTELPGSKRKSPANVNTGAKGAAPVEGGEFTGSKRSKAQKHGI